MGDEENCIRVIVPALTQVSRRINGEALDSAASDVPVVSNKEAAEFVDMLTSIVASVEKDVEKLRRIVFEVNPSLLPVLISFLKSPHFATPVDDLAELFVSALRCINRIVCGCCCDQVESSTSASSYLSSLCADVLHKNDAVLLIVSMLSPISSPDVQFASAEALFALLMRSEVAKDDLACSKSLSTLLAPLSEATSDALRAYIAACVRELANSHASRIASDAVIDLLARLLALDNAADVRALAAETVDVLFKSEPAVWAHCTRKKELATCIISKLERENTFEVMEATLKLAETLIVADAGLSASAESSFTDFFLAGFGDRSLVTVLSAGNRVASLAARCLRLLTQLAPYYRHVGFNVFQHFPSLTKITSTVIDLSQAVGDNGNVLHQIQRVELSMALSMMLAQDPRCRQLLSSHLHDDTSRMQRLRAATLANLNSAAIEYYGSINVVDVTGTLVNDVGSVEWEVGMRPTRLSIHAVFDRQERRWEAIGDDVPVNVPDARKVRPEGDSGEAKMTRLTFIILSYGAHLTLTPTPDMLQAPPHEDEEASEGDNGVASGAGRRQQQTSMHRQASMTGIRFTGAERPSTVSPQRMVETEYGTVGDGGVGGSLQRGGRGPFPTRTSILREWRSHPEKFAAIQKAAHHPELINKSRPSHYYHDPMRDHSMGNSRIDREKGPASPRRKEIFTKFDCALKLCTHFSQCFNNVGDPAPVIYETTGDGFARRQAPHSAYFTTPNQARSKSWTIQTLKEGDLFYFAVPFVALNAFALEQVRLRALRHAKLMERSFIITPQKAKMRRWFLYDMVNHIMPGVINTLTDLLDFFSQHGDENVKFPIVMFREKDFSVEGQQASLHSGNLVEVVDQVRFYFEKTAAQNQQLGALGAQRGVNTQYLQDLEEKIAALNNMKFTGEEASFAPPGYDPDGRRANSAAAAARIGSSDDESDEVSVAEPMGFKAASSRSALRSRRTRLFDDDISDVSSVE